MIQDGKGQTVSTDKHSLVFPRFLPRSPSGYAACALVTKNRGPRVGEAVLRCGTGLRGAGAFRVCFRGFPGGFGLLSAFVFLEVVLAAGVSCEGVAEFVDGFGAVAGCDGYAGGFVGEADFEVFCAVEGFRPGPVHEFRFGLGEPGYGGF